MSDDPNRPPAADSSQGIEPHYERPPEILPDISRENATDLPPENLYENSHGQLEENSHEQLEENSHAPLEENSHGQMEENRPVASEVEVYVPETDTAKDDDEEEGGGPVKTFLEHLEDLRWTILKCTIAIFLGFIVCLSAGKQIISIVEWPLDQAKKLRTDPEARVVFTLGTNFVGRVPLRDFPFANAPTNQNLYLRLTPITIGGQTVMGLVNDTNPPTSATDNIRLDLKVYTPGGGFVIAMQIAFFGGFTISAPFVLFFIGQFVLPAMHVHEKRFLYRVSGFATMLFFLGIAFCYFVMLPITFSTTTLFSNWLGFSADEWKADDFISFTMWFLLGMGVSFELPLVLLSLVKIGLLTWRQLNQFRMYWVVAGLVISGFVTPDGNPLTMLLMFLPLHILYEISVVIAWFWGREERAAENAMDT